MSTPPNDDDARDRLLALAASAGDRKAFGELVARRYDGIYRMAWRFTRSREDAQDIAQDVAIRLARAVGTWRGAGSLDGFLRAVTLNAVRDHARRRARVRRLAAGLRLLSLTDAPPDRQAPDDSPAERLWSAVRRLPARMAEAVTLVHGEGLSHAEAGEVLRCSPATVSWQIHEARKRLKTTLADEVDR